jgi:hypothetical protein
LCERPFQFGPHLYKGRHVAAWGIQFCDVCLRANWDGIVLSGHPRLEQHLQDKGISTRPNAKGLLDIPA